MAIINIKLTDTFDYWRVKTNALAIETGDLSLLQTSYKTDIVGAINELKLRADEQGNLADLNTVYKGDIVGAINELVQAIAVLHP